MKMNRVVKAALILIFVILVGMNLFLFSSSMKLVMEFKNVDTNLNQLVRDTSTSISKLNKETGEEGEKGEAGDEAEKEKLDEDESEVEEPVVVVCEGEPPTALGPEYRQSAKQLKEKGLCASYNHHKKFFQVKDKTFAWLMKEKESLLYEKGRQMYAIEINKKYALRHIFKNAGSSVMDYLMATEHLLYETYRHGEQTLIAVVRDPIDHFLSGWAECGARSPDPENDPSFASTADLDSRVQSWVSLIQNCVEEEQQLEFRVRSKECLCMVHSMPQANFIIDHDWHTQEKLIDYNLGMVGDMSDLYGILEVAGHVHQQKELPQSRKADDEGAKDSFPRDQSLLSEETIHKICEFVILDYYFFDFEPPASCREQVQSDMLEIREMPLLTEEE
mmetsp:Transcript_9782/g.12323  ORF Transcript_9782/g.12323 Transcript_9782/m.12323 type:complete len:390 (+) Transcript_9782:48-1217(+)